MKLRQMPYGYMIRDGRYTIKDDEAGAVKEVFLLYRNGRSYREISNIMNQSCYPPHGADGWNKHHIKRMLENTRYLGDGTYPAIISKEEYHAVRTIHDKKVIVCETTDKSADILWKCMACGECGQRLLRFGFRKAEEEIIGLRCENSECGARIHMLLKDLYSAVCALMIQASNDACARYVPSYDAIKLESQISRAIMRPDNPAEAVRLILQGIDARYGSIPAPPELPRKIQNDDANRLLEPDWKLFKGAVSHISLSRMGIGLKMMSGRKFFMERNDGHADSGAASKRSNGYPRQS